MVKADGKIAEVSAASILAKVTHDRDILLEAKRAWILPYSYKEL